MVYLPASFSVFPSATEKRQASSSRAISASLRGVLLPEAKVQAFVGMDSAFPVKRSRQFPCTSRLTGFLSMESVATGTEALAYPPGLAGGRGDGIDARQ